MSETCMRNFSQQEQVFLCACIRQAGEIVRGYYQQWNIEIKTKAHALDFVTTADLAVDRFLSPALQKQFPTHKLLSEETENRLDSYAGAMRVIDPIDGTRAFVEHTDAFAIMIGHATDGIADAGWIYYPVSDELYRTIGDGVTYRKSPTGKEICKMSDISDLHGARVIHSTGMERLGRHNQIAQLQRTCLSIESNLGGNNDRKLLLGTKDASIATVATWWAWDLCAPAALIHNAGGKATDAQGVEVCFSPSQEKYTCIESNGYLHDQIVALMRDE